MSFLEGFLKRENLSQAAVVYTKRGAKGVRIGDNTNSLT
jgi:hypothetical protein